MGKHKEYGNTLISENIYRYIGNQQPQIMQVCKFLLFERNLQHTKGDIVLPDEWQVKDFMDNYIYNVFMPHYNTGSFLLDESYMTMIMVKDVNGADVPVGLPKAEHEFSKMICTEAKIILGLQPKEVYGARKYTYYFEKKEYSKSTSKFTPVTKNMLDEVCELYLSSSSLVNRIFSFMYMFEYVFERPIGLKKIVEEKNMKDGMVLERMRECLKNFLNIECRSFINLSSIADKYGLIPAPLDKRYNFFSDIDYKETNTMRLDRPIFDLVFSMEANKGNVVGLGWVLMEELSKYVMVLMEQIEGNIGKREDLDLFDEEVEYDEFDED